MIYLASIRCHCTFFFIILPEAGHRQYLPSIFAQKRASLYLATKVLFVASPQACGKISPLLSNSITEICGDIPYAFGDIPSIFSDIPGAFFRFFCGDTPIRVQKSRCLQATPHRTLDTCTIWGFSEAFADTTGHFLPAYQIESCGDWLMFFPTIALSVKFINRTN